MTSLTNAAPPAFSSAPLGSEAVAFGGGGGGVVLYERQARGLEVSAATTSRPKVRDFGVRPGMVKTPVNSGVTRISTYDEGMGLPLTNSNPCWRETTSNFSPVTRGSGTSSR